MITPNLTRPFALPALLVLAASASAQTAAKPPVPHTAATGVHRTTAGAGPACSKLPEISSKVPAVPAGSPCAKPLYTVVSTPAVKLEYVSPMEGPGLKETLGLDTASFSLDYIDTKIGTGELAAAHKWYTIHYTGYLVDGTKFDSSVDRKDPIVIPYGGHQVIPGWDTGFDGMHVGGKRRLFIPYQLAYGPNGKGPIPAKAELIFDVELISQSDAKPEPKTPPAPPAPPAGAPKAPTAPASATPGTTDKPATPPPAQSTTPDTKPKP